MTRPRLDECNRNPQAYFSGQYCVCGLCSSRKFATIGLVLHTLLWWLAPGICFDQVAFERTLLPEMMQAFPVGTYCGGNAAYLVIEKMIVPFTGSSQPSNPCKDAHSSF
jgi:hypothetical protein